jgi:insulysin
MIRKPVTDAREYRQITLGNKLEALLISDPAADKSAAALDVRVGSLFDPPQAQGLAHFLEHMLFLGTQKYPSEDEYQSYLAKHGGMSNAFTADNHTCYFFNIAPEYLEGALDRFGQFFISPLFTQSATERELNAVNSEHSKNVQEDMWRQYQLMRTVCFKEGHPAHHFSTGNKETLGGVPRDVLLNFHKAWYSANVSKVAVLGKESLNELESMVTKIFSEVPNKDVVVPLGTGFSQPEFMRVIGEVAGTPVDTSKLSFPESSDVLSIPRETTISSACIGKNLVIAPVKEQRSLQFCWFLPEQRRLWKSKPSRYLAHVLGHEGPGSLTSVLKARGFATDLVSGLFYDNVGLSLMKVEVHLPKTAAESIASNPAVVEEISEIVAAYIRLSREEITHSTWKEMETIENLNFTFQPTMDPMSSVQTVVNAMHYLPAHEVLAGQKMIYEFDEHAIKTHLEELVSERMFLTTVGKEFQHMCDMTEKWYGTKYGLLPINAGVFDAFKRIESLAFDEVISRCNELGLAMPKPNPFLPENLELIPARTSDGTKEPKLLSGTASTFFKQDNQFKIPKAKAAFAMYCPYVQSGLEQYVNADLLVQSLNEDHSQVAYQAEVAGLKYKLRTTREGLQLSVGGYSDKLPVIAESVVEKMAEFQPSESVFNLVKDRTVRQLQSQLLQKAPYSQAIDLTHQVLLKPFYSISQKLAQVLATKSTQQLPAMKQVLAGAYMEGLIEGNVDPTGANELTSTVRRSVTAVPSEKVSDVQVMKLDDNIVIRRKGVNPNETNGAVVVSVEAGWVAPHVSESNDSDLKTAALVNLTSQICGQKFFDDLRTKQQLGYICHSAASVQERRTGMLFLVQSEVPTGEVLERVMEFINKLENTTNEISEEEFQQYIGAVVADLLEKPKNQEEEFQNHWGEIEKRRFDFGRKDRLIPVVEALKKDELVAFVREQVVNAPKVTAIVTGSNDTDLEELLSDDDVAQLRADAKWVHSYSKPVSNDLSSKM